MWTLKNLVQCESEIYHRWSGQAPEPRAGLSSGHMPHALSLPFNALLSPASDGKPYTSFLPIDQLREIIVRALASPRAKLDLAVENGGLTAEELAVGQRRWDEVKSSKKGVTWSCGSGMTAAVGIWAMRLVASAEGEGSLDNLALYDEVCRRSRRVCRV
jgi:thiosulfate/3-mercaptopyruvate sulfurtransferase